MLSKSEEKDCLETDGLMRVVREERDSDTEEARKAFGIIFNKYKNDLWQLCLSVCGDNGDADLVYEATWRKIWKRPTYDFKSYKVSFRTWMAVIAKRSWLDIRRKAVLSSDVETPDYAVYPEEFDFEGNCEIPDMNKQLLEEALHQLNEREYDILLTYIEYDTDQMKHVPNQIIEALTTKYQTTSANLRKIKSRALQKVKDYIDQHRCDNNHFSYE